MLVPSEAGGPKTEEGKEVVRWNATRHGVRSPAPVIPGVEKAAGVTQAQVGRGLDLGKSATDYRVKLALNSSYLENQEDPRGRPAGTVPHRLLRERWPVKLQRKFYRWDNDGRYWSLSATLRTRHANVHAQVSFAPSGYFAHASVSPVSQRLREWFGPRYAKGAANG